MGTDTQLRKGCIFDLLSNPRRRMVLFYLRKRGCEMAVKELAEEIAATENDIDVESVTYKQRKRVHVSLYQTHLQRLADAGVVRHEKDEGTVRLTDRATEIEPYLEATHGQTYPWHKHYLSLAVISSLALLAHLIGVPGFETIPSVALGGIVTLTFGTSGIAQFVVNLRDGEEAEIAIEPCEDSH